jgi:hypothetical protein
VLTDARSAVVTPHHLPFGSPLQFRAALAVPVSQRRQYFETLNTNF